MLKMDSYLKLRKRKKDSFLTFDHKNGIFDDKIQLLMYNLIIYMCSVDKGTVLCSCELT